MLKTPLSYLAGVCETLPLLGFVPRQENHFLKGVVAEANFDLRSEKVNHPAFGPGVWVVTLWVDLDMMIYAYRWFAAETYTRDSIETVAEFKSENIVEVAKWSLKEIELAQS